MKSYIFITIEGYTFQPESEAIEPDIENCQVVGFAEGVDAQEAFANLVQENEYLVETTFDEVVCLELRHTDYSRHSQYFHLNDYKATSKVCEE